MRLLLSAYACRPNAGSEPGYGWNWATHLAARGIEVHVLVAQRNQESIEARLRNGPIPNLHFAFVRVPYAWAKRSEALHYACWQICALTAARRLNREFKFQIAHHVTYGSVHVPSQLWRLGIPVVFGPVGGGQTAPASMLKYFGAERSKEQRRTSITRALPFSPVHGEWLRRMNFILAANRDTLRLVSSLGCKNTSLMCDAGLPDSYFANEPRDFEEAQGALRLLWVGRMLARKALPLALDALKAVRQDVILTIAGEGIDPGVVHQMISERNLQKRVFWKGSRLTWSEVRTAYLEHDAMLFTSLRDSFGSQLLEAMAMGLPIIALDLHGAHDFVPPVASIKVAVGSPDETVRNLATAIEQYASFSQVRKTEMSVQASKFAKTLSWSARAGQVQQLYNDILSQTDPLNGAFVSTMRAASI